MKNWLLSVGAVKAHTAFVSNRLPSQQVYTHLQLAVASVAIPYKRKAAQKGEAEPFKLVYYHFGDGNYEKKRDKEVGKSTSIIILHQQFISKSILASSC